MIITLKILSFTKNTGYPLIQSVLLIMLIVRKGVFQKWKTLEF